MRHSICRRPKLGVLPTPAAVGGYFHLANGAATGPSQATDLVESRAGQLLSRGRKGDDRFASNLDRQRDDFRVFLKMPIVVIGHVVAVHHLDSPQILRLIDSFEAGNHQPQWETLLRTHWLAILAVAHQTAFQGLRSPNP